MNALAAGGAGFLLAVLWFDLMFDVQVRRTREGTLSASILDSIATYYRRVTTDASPMGRLVSLMMLLTTTAIATQIVEGGRLVWLQWCSLALALSAFALVGARTFRFAARLGSAVDDSEVLTRLARVVYRDHLYCLCAMTVVFTLQVLQSFVE